jgi:hypothetical protein
MTVIINCNKIILYAMLVDLAIFLHRHRHQKHSQWPRLSVTEEKDIERMTAHTSQCDSSFITSGIHGAED